MKIALMSYTLARGPWGKNPNLKELCELASSLQIEGIDWVTLYGFSPEQVVQVTSDYGLKNVCYTFFAPLHNAEKRAEAMDLIKRGLDTANVLGADKIMLPLGGVEGQSREYSRQLALEGLAKAVSLGAAQGVTVTVEHFHGRLAPFITSEDMEQAVAAVPGLRITYDNGNVYTSGGDPAEAFTRVHKYIVHAHFKDWRVVEEGRLQGLDGRFYTGALVGEGVVDPKPCLEAMAAAGYEGYINMEYEGQEYDPKEAIIRGTKYLQELIASLT
ncbi:MAG: sugar phosphate isomerase/epimerase [Firmicutes bacterium]|jgi:sugar phosphate isomerase/epimerase|nr:sugar phosphate isomerase/epimerase [Bacillota bacterium]